ncbi:DUF2637 domain-containing protein [Cellulomonas sp. DKR-3]|uniref:DUF2637 domain-containing protein n=1 Tax=Cellulomonas fulva TaxID=2835530 RepID=A0ABS5U271_9CELL|nr:helix-turn-helix domain-containing protein [Cellulomonas fulva]MBT0995490.1 DUF2637 domain-containing protein [Cellulomonas fulva]
MITKPKTTAHPTVHRARIPADAIAVLVVQTLVLAGIWVCAVVVSFTGLIAAAGWANVAEGQRVFVPLFIDGVLIGGSLAYLVAKERHDRASRSIAAVAMVAFAALSVAGNAVHALAASTSGPERAVGVLIAVAAPIAILVTTELLARTVIASPDENVPAPSRASRRRAQVQPTLPALTAPTTQATPTPVAPTAPAPTVRPVSASTGTVRSGREEARAEFLALLAAGMSARGAAAAVGVPPSTGTRWAAAAREAGAVTDQGALVGV